jgi:hypothetical protein
MICCRSWRAFVVARSVRVSPDEIESAARAQERTRSETQMMRELRNDHTELFGLRDGLDHG